MADTAVRVDAHTMQVPADLASRLSTVARSIGRSPEAMLREAINRLIESTMQAGSPSAQTLAALDETLVLHTGFVPQPQSFAVYE